MSLKKALKTSQMGLDDLPKVVPLLPLSSMILLPRARIPLPIVSAHQFSLIADAWSRDRFLGVLQPQSSARNTQDTERTYGAPLFYSSGCLARMTELGEFDDGKLFVMLTGVCRFHLMEHMRRPLNGPKDYVDHDNVLPSGEQETGVSSDELFETVSVDFEFRDEDDDDATEDAEPISVRDETTRMASVLYGRVDYTPYAVDMGVEVDYAINRPQLVQALSDYFERIHIQADQEDLQSISDAQLVSTLAMTYPFSPRERQAVLQCATLSEQSRMMLTLIEMEKKDTWGMGEHRMH